MINLYYIESPFQFMNCIEYYYSINKEQSLFILRSAGNKKTQNINDEIVKHLPNDCQIKKIELSGINIKSIFNFIILIVTILSIRDNVAKFIFGDFRGGIINIMRKLIRPRNSVLVDDGNITIEIYNSFIKKNIGYYGLKRLGIDIFKEGNAEILLFTVYKELIGCQSVVHNNFSYFKTINKKNEYENFDAIIIGSALSENKLMSADYEIEVLEWIDNEFGKNKKIAYFPHRNDSADKLSLIAATGYYVLDNAKFNFEIEYLTNSIRCEKLIGVFSTVLETIKFINKNQECYSIVIDEKFFNNNKITEYFSNYARYEAKGINLIFMGKNHGSNNHLNF